METIARSPTRSCLLLFVISLGTVFYGLGELPLTGADEPRYARISEEMWRADRWVTPLLEGRPWLEKPPLSYWMTIPFYAVLKPGEATARAGSALSAIIASLSMLWLGRRLLTPLAGLYAGVILLTAVGFCGYGRSASTDMPFVACLTAALALFAVVVLSDKASSRMIVGGYIVLGLAVLAKGPVAAVLAGGAVILFWWLDEHGGAMRKLRVIPGLLITGAVALPWFWLAFQENGYSFISVFFINHNLARYVSEIHHHTQPFYYYLPVFLGLFFPWSGWLPLLVYRVPSEKQESRTVSRLTLFVVCWLLFPIVFFSFSRSKLPGYILPCLPPAALLLGNRLAEMQRHRISRLVAWFYPALSISMSVVMLMVFQNRYGGRWQLGVFLSVAILLPVFVAFKFARRGEMNRAVSTTALQGMLLIIAAVLFTFPTLGAYHSAREIAREALAARATHEPIVTYRFFHHALNYYTGYEIAANLTDVGELERFSVSHPRFFLVTDATLTEEVRMLPALSATPVAGQGRLRLLHVVRQ